MRAREFTQEMQTTRGGRPRVYLDMDGVLADFFAEWAKLAGVESGSYRDIPPAKVDPTLNKMIGTDFFQRLPKFPTADALVSMIVKEFGGYSICSSPLRGDHENSAQNKRVWIQDNLDPQPDTMEFTGRKEKFARQKDGTPNILIDDRGTNITRWEEAGGIGIKYQADEDGLDVIRRGLARADRIISGQEQHKPQKLQSLDRSQVMSTGDDLTPDSIHDLADQRGVAWDNDAEFMAQSQRLTGKRHLDDMTPMELARIRAWLKGLPVKENFADGKKPGRKGLAKRVGVDCRQPVSKLRSIAASSSGERQRIAHWCANMKSGRKDK